jgi:GTPase SAR1 family protein
MCCGDERNNQVGRELDADKKAASKDHKLLLLGAGSSGKSTFFKQLCQIHGNGFQQQDREQARQNVYDCVIDQMKQLIEQCNVHIEMGHEGYIIDGEAGKAAENLGGPRVPNGGLIIGPDYQQMITTLWDHPAIKKTFKTRANLGVVDSAPHFFEDIKRIGHPDYEPTEQDILLVRIQTTGMRTAHFSVDNNNFTIVDVGGQRNERSKWIHQFSVVDAVLFVASLSCYDQNLFEEDDVNAMHESIRLFQVVIGNRYFRSTSMILFLNKMDLFEVKIRTKPIKICFPQYAGPNDGSDDDKEQALKFITDVFTTVGQEMGQQRQIYTHVTCATDSQNVQKVFHDVQHAVVVAALQRNGIM